MRYNVDDIGLGISEPATVEQTVALEEMAAFESMQVAFGQTFSPFEDGDPFGDDDDD